MSEDSTLDVLLFIAKALDEHWGEFSYGSELVTHGFASLRDNPDPQWLPSILTS
jgi:hypothetical protein